MGMVGMEMSMKGMYMAGITLQQPVYAGGKLSTQTKWQKTGVAISEETKAYPNQYPGRGGADVLDVCSVAEKVNCLHNILNCWIRCISRSAVFL
mgnify:CR=1 FL=1